MRSLKAITRSSFCLSRKRFKPPLEITEELLDNIRFYVGLGDNRKALAKKLKITIGELEELERDNPLLRQTIKDGERVRKDIDSHMVKSGMFKYNDEGCIVRDESFPLCPISCFENFKVEARKEKRIRRELRKEKQASKQNEYKKENF